ncbi:hypothetical protein N7474_008994 [Penicillium riverlandense]|uniref:uncharacterized protein n=1 Tax=Penicillium riverlandense TaxID=1903569 RepID=UPI0025474AB3|nr:uncharacterized protein N7474_008994 [Penicillium riverlandense]KAJ5807725.1 hypothetical protein N7474_008994 [Penicillium riverlandense]
MRPPDSRVSEFSLVTIHLPVLDGTNISDNIARRSSSNIMSLPPDFLAASGHEVSSLPTPDSRGLGSRPVHKHKVPTPPTPGPPRREPSLAQSPSLPPPPTPIPQSLRDSSCRHLLPPAMTDLKLGMDHDSLPLTPFSYFVAPEPLPFQGPKLFHRFMDLPLEIHLMIFRYCDTPTLFHLMHTSSYTRYECLELFWEPEHNTWYRPEYAKEMFDDKVFPIYHCPEFASRVTQVEISLNLLPLYQRNRRALSGRAFWDKLQELFPSVQNVVLSGNDPRHLPGEDDKEYSRFSDLVAMAPPNITPFVAFKYGGYEGALRYRLWRVEAGACWSIVEDPWTPMRVLPPAKKIPFGLLNAFLSIERVAVASTRESRGRDWLILETYARYSDSSGIDCPDPGCNTNFSTLEELKMHLWYDPHGFRNSYGLSMMKCHRNTPVELKAILDTKQRRFDEMIFIVTVLVEELREQYHKHGEAGKRQFKEALAGQMKEHGYLAPDESLDNSEQWLNLYEGFEDDTDDDYPEYPDEKDFDRDYPEEEDFDHEYAGEEYFD